MADSKFNGMECQIYSRRSQLSNSDNDAQRRSALCPAQGEGDRRQLIRRQCRG
nr:MAG TPA: hypothetical protein [Caudoviricetes sp.]